MNSFLILAEALLTNSPQKDVSVVSAKTFVIIVFAVIGVFFFIAQASGAAEKAAKQTTGNLRKRPAMPPAEVAALVTGLARDTLGIGPHQVDEPMEKLRIARGEYLTFLDDLAQDHGLQVPASARAMSTSISGLISAVCEGSSGRA